MRYLLTIGLLFITITFSDGIIKPSVSTKRQKANFLIALRVVLKYEGGLANHPMDKGGKTYAGITYKWNKNWNGWKRLDDLELLTYWIMDYYLHIWITEGFDQLENQTTANYLFDTRINISRNKCIKLLNKRLGLNVKYTKRWIEPRFDSVNLDRLRLERMNYYRQLVVRNPSQRVFLKGWLRRSRE